MGQNEISFCLATSNFSAGDHDMVFSSWKIAGCRQLRKQNFLAALGEIQEYDERDS